MVDEIGKPAEQKAAQQMKLLSTDLHFPLRDGNFFANIVPAKLDGAAKASIGRMVAYAKGQKKEMALNFNDGSKILLNKNTTTKTLIAEIQKRESDRKKQEIIQKKQELKEKNSRGEKPRKPGENFGFEGQRTRTQRHNVATSFFR